MSALTKTAGWKCWTMKHGHLLVMGGYQLGNGDFEENEESRLEVLTVDRFKELIEENPNFEFPRITVPEINDYSKGDGLSKLLAILQVSWFIIQCLARHFQGLALTELELVTLAMASLNAITYGFWWNKPLSVAGPVVYVKEPMGEKVGRTGNNGDENEDSEEELEMDRIARAVIAPLVAHSHGIQIPDRILGFGNACQNLSLFVHICFPPNLIDGSGHRNFLQFCGLHTTMPQK